MIRDEDPLTSETGGLEVREGSGDGVSPIFFSLPVRLSSDRLVTMGN